MARSRNIKPGFFKNDLLAEVDPLGRLLFAGLWTIADREGRLEDRPKKIKAEVLPYDDCNIEALLQGLASRGFILRYQVDGTGFIQVVNWDKHQQPHVKEQASIIPAPPEHPTCTIQTPDKPDSCTEQESLIPDSLNLIPHSVSNETANAVSTVVATAASPKKKRRTQDEILQPYPQEVRDVANHCIRVWRKEDPDGRPIVCDKDLLCANIASVLKDHQTVTSAELIQGVDDYLAKDKQRYCAPQFYFGPGKPGETPHWAVQTRMIRHQASREAPKPLLETAS